jgi:hypothetical protein
MNCRNIFYICTHLLIQMIHFPCPDGGIGRRARLKLVYLGVWVRFPLRVLTRTKRPLKKFRGFFVSYYFLIILESLKKLKIRNKFQNTRYVLYSRTIGGTNYKVRFIFDFFMNLQMRSINNYRVT